MKKEMIAASLHDEREAEYLAIQAQLPEPRDQILIQTP